MILTSNGIPDHHTGSFPNIYNPNSILAQAYRFQLPLVPQIAATPGVLLLGPIGMTISGAPFFNPFNARGQDATVYEVLDTCNGHPSPFGQYHYHTNPVCAYTDTPGQHSPVIGYALDGFALHGPQGEGGAPPTDLDTCNGHTGQNGAYHYHVTKAFPYLLGCYKGVVQYGPPGR
jgi:hypothetical protein